MPRRHKWNGGAADAVQRVLGEVSCTQCGLRTKVVQRPGKYGAHRTVSVRVYYVADAWIENMPSCFTRPPAKPPGNGVS